MTTAAKYGAQDLNGNPFNYQQLVTLPSTNASTTNTVVNTTFTNRAAYDARVRMALTNTPIGSQVVSNVHGSQSFVAQQSAASTLVETQQVLTIDTSSATTNAFTTASYVVTATTENTNLITVSSTATFAAGQPVVFSASAGNLTAGVVYYILTVNSSTTFTVSPIWNGPVQMLTTSAFPMIVQQTVNNLSVGMPINFHGATFGYSFYNMNFYVASLPGGASGTTFSIAAYPGGPTIPLVSAIGTMSVVPVVTPVANPATAQYPTAMASALTLGTSAQAGYNGMLQGVTVTASTASSNVLTTALFAITATTATTGTSGFSYITTSASTNLLTVGQSVVFSATISGSAVYAGITYYVHSIISSTTFSISTSFNGQPVSLGTNGAVTGVNMYLATTYLQTNQQVIFTGTSFGGIIPNIPYYVLTVPSNNTFTVSTAPGGPAAVLSTTTGTMVVSSFTPPTVPQLVLGSSQAGVTISVTGSTTSVINCVSTTGLATNQPIIFSASFGGLTLGTTYYVVSGFASTTFQVSATAGGSAITLTASTGTLNGQALSYFNTYSTTVTATTVSTNLITVTNTSNFVPGQPVVFSAAIGGLAINTVYYVLNVYNTTQLVVSASQGGVAFPLITATGSVTMSQATTGLAVNQPLQIGNVTIQVTATATSGSLITCNNTVNLVANQPIIFSGAIGSITANTVYYVSTTPSTTTFTISLTSGGGVFAQSNATATVTAQQGTFSTVTPGVVYYVYSVTSLTSFAISSINSAPSAFALTTVASGSQLAAFQSIIPTISLGTSTATGAIYALNNTYTTSTVSASSATTTDITVASVATLAAGQPVTFLFNSGANATANGIFSFVSVTGTTTSTNVISISGNTTGLTIGQSIVFNGSLGGLTYGTVYYILTIPNTTTFTVSTTPYGSAVSLSTATGTITGYLSYYITYVNTSSTTIQISGTYNGPIIVLTSGSIVASSTVQHATSNLSAGQPIFVTGTTFGGTTTSTTYYVRTVPTLTQFTISTSPFGQITTLSATTGTIPTLIGPRPIFTVSSATSSNQIASQAYAVTATTATTNLITVNSTYAFTVGMPVVFSGALGGLVSGMVYYVSSIPTATAFTVSPTLGGQNYALSTATGSVNAQQATSNLWLNQPLQFQGSTSVGSPYTGITSGTTYYVRSIDSTTLFTISTALSIPGTTSTVATLTGGGQIIALPIANNIVDAFAYYTPLITVSATSATSPTYYVTVASTANLAVGQPIIFTGTTLLGGVSANTTYYVNAIASSTQLNISLTYGGPIVTLTAGSGTMYVQQSTAAYSSAQTVILNSPTVIVTATTTSTNIITCNSTTNLVVGQPIVFGNMTYPTTAIGNIVAGTVYYVLTIGGSTTFTISTTPTGSAFALTTTATQFAAQQGIFGQQYGVNGQNYVVQSTPNATSLVLARVGASISPAGVGLMPMPVVAPIQVTATSGTGPNYAITVSSTAQLTVNQPVIFIGSAIGGLTATVNQLINPTVYYVSAILSATTFNVSTSAGGGVVTLTGVTANTMAVLPLSATGVAIAYSFNSTPALTIGATTTSTNVLTTLGYSVSGNATTTANLLTVSSTVTFVVGQAVTFSAAFCGLNTSITYYVASVQSSTTFTVSGFWGGPDVILSGSGSATMSETTSFLQLNQPITFVAASYVGGLTAGSNYGVTYYVTNIGSSTTFIVSTVPGAAGNQLALTTTTGTTTAQVGCYRAISFNSTNNGTAVLQTQTFAVTATASVNGTMLVTASNTFALYPGMAVAFSGTLGFLAANTIYYVLFVYDEKRFAVTTAPVNSIGVATNTTTVLQTINGALLTHQTTTGSITVTQSPSRLQQNQAVVFYSTIGGAVLGGVTQGTIYYVQAVNPVSGTIAISTTPGGSALTLSAVNNTGTTQTMMMVPLTTWVPASNVMITEPMPIYSGTTSTNIFTTGNLALVTNTSYGTNYITCLSTSALAVGMPIVFGSSMFGSLTSAVTYYVAQIINSTQFTVSLTWGGQVAILTQGTGAVTVQQSTALMTIGQPVFITGTAFAPTSTGNIGSYVTYYIATIPSVTTFTVATTLANAIAGTAVAIATTTYGYMTLTASNANALTNMSNVIGPSLPIAFTGSQINITAITGSNLYTPNGTALLSANQAVVFTGYGYTNQTSGTIQPGTTYYIKAVLDNNTFTLTSTPSGATLSWVTETNVLTMQIVSSLGSSLVPYSTYFILSTPTPNTFQIATSSATASGLTLTLPSAVPQAAGNTLVKIDSNIITLAQAQGATNTFFVPNTPVTFTAVSGATFGVSATLAAGSYNGAPTYGTPFIVTAVATNGNITINSSAANLLVVGQPIMFTNPLSPLTSTSGLVPFQTYYVLTVSTTTITVASSWPSSTAITFAAAWSSQTTVSGFYAVPMYYVKAVLDSRRIMLSATLNGATWPITNATGTVPGNYTAGTNVMVINSQPSFTDFLEHDVALSPNGTFERTGILVPPNTYLYVSSSQAQVSAIATGIQEAV